MSEDTVAEYFVEVISNVSHANGVFRVTFAQQEAGSAVKPTTRLLIPANQLGRILNGLNNVSDSNKKLSSRNRWNTKFDGRVILKLSKSWSCKSVCI